MDSGSDPEIRLDGKASMLFRRKKKYLKEKLSPDEIFMDSANVPGFDQGRMEGRLEMPLSKKSVSAFFLVFAGIAVIFSIQLFRLQIVKGEEFGARALSNRLEVHLLLPQRGLILDRHGEKLAWNDPSFQIVLNSEAIRENIDARILKEILSFLNISAGEDEISARLRDVFESGKDVVLGSYLNWSQVEQVRENFPDVPFRVESAAVRRYIHPPGFAHLLGYLGYPSDRTKAFLSSFNVKSGKSGIELLLDEKLSGVAGKRAAEVDSKGRVVTQAVQQDVKDGAAVMLTIDAGLQTKLARSIASVAEERGFRGGAGIVFDINSGEILAITSFPEFDSNLLSSGISQEELNRVSADPANPFFSRATDGLYQPGSVIKPLIAIAALNEDIISPEKEIFSSGSISVLNPYFPDKTSVFHDWKAHGWVNMRRALAVSSNVYFYEVGGGYENTPGLGVARIEEYLRLFGFDGEIDFLLPNAGNFVLGPEWKRRNNPSDPDWRIGDTYNLSIGQSVLVTPLAIARFASAIALDGRIFKFKILDEPNEKPEIEMAIDIPGDYFKIVKEGMRQAVLEGTAQAMSGVGVSVAGKTGTAEIGNGRVHSWFMGFMPYENPKMAIVIVLESGDAKNLVGAAAAARGVVSWVVAERPEYVVNNSIDNMR